MVSFFGNRCWSRGAEFKMILMLPRYFAKSMANIGAFSGRLSIIGAIIVLKCSLKALPMIQTVGSLKRLEFTGNSFRTKQALGNSTTRFEEKDLILRQILV
jgi:hypothetical protein